MRGKPTIDHQFGGADVLGLVRGEEERRIGHVPGVAHLPGRALRIADRDHPLDIALRVDVGQRSRDHRRVHHAGQDGVGTDALARVLQGNAAGELDDPGLAGGIGDVGHADPADPGHRSNVDDGPGPLAFHHRQHRLAGQEHGGEVDLHDPVPGLQAGVHRAADLGNADVVVQHVDAAPEIEAARDHGLDLIGFRDIDGLRFRGAALGLDQTQGLFCRGGIAVDAEHLGALAREDHRRRLAVTPARPRRPRAGDNRHLVLQPTRHA